MGLFSKPNIPSIDVGALTGIVNQNANKQRDIVSGLRNNLTPLSTDFENKRRLLGNQVQTGAENLVGQYGQDLSAVNSADANARNAANTAVREQSFRDVPELQRSIRESLGGSGLLNSGGALSALSRPVLEANRSARDFANENEINRLSGVTGRSEKLADTGLNLRNNALQSKLGLDEGTINYLNSIGRGDLIDEAGKLLGIQDQQGANLLGIEQARQANEIEKAKAAASNRAGIFSSLGSLGGAAIGFGLGGPLGAGLGSQLGGTFGNLAGGGQGAPFDPTLLYAMAARNPATAARKTAVVNSLGGTIPVRPY